MKKFLALCSAVGVLSLCSCSVNINGTGNNMTLGFIKKDSETKTIDVKGIKEIKIDIDVGDCNIIAGDSEEAVIKTSCEYKAISEKKARKALENTELRCEIKGDSLHIDFINSETGKKIGSIQNGNLVNIITDIEVILPDNFRTFDISTDVGEIEISDFSGAFDISSEVGDVTAKNLIITGKSNFDSDVGDIDCIVESISGTELELKTDVGDIDLSLGKTEKSEIDISSDIGNITLDTQGKSYEEISSEKDVVKQEKEILIDGRCRVEMKADVGDIKISK
ncbi:MAG: hypothetical protein K2G83_07520 [Ruminococcus sp.]|nr:hypothetical protein [Ruminococcus sp.]